ncbi:glutamate-5-semialdehyde dehydrogenase [Endomicrobium proavitum]|uniref:Gamma-glutamyl phosphate reductase n=1 Tax=Endomicrobium proavitum TaxID=1408281 RepID=A0A0G3WKG8_9BACT|nr:glutamate-5-semialdehyde dehydrogenase [Endomicrobium proavitum]AKL98382.1 Gamma-glutamyl phosphate reductase [Endomicrobium proavitum]
MENNELKQKVLSQAASAKDASRALAVMTAQQKSKILLAMADALSKNAKDILFHNEIDVEAAKEAGLAAVLTDRLTLNEARVNAMIQGVRDVAALKDPVGEIVEDLKPAQNIDVKKIRVPLGVIAMIYEARPNVTVDAATLCLKAGNAVILKGGSEAMNSNRILAKIIYDSAVAAGMPAGAIQFIDTTDRSAVTELLALDKYVDLLIPRGSEELVNFIRKNTLIPVLSHGKGLCHTYIDKDADLKTALEIAVNAKCQRPAVCNAMETLLVHKDVAAEVLPAICKLYSEEGVEVRGCPLARNIIPEAKEAVEADWSTEYHDKIISIKVVNSLDEAIAHINKYGSQHSDAIVTKDKSAADKFLAQVDSAGVFVNASTRLHDGSVFGLGCEIGISTQKLHARGAMGLKELTTTKYIVRGQGNIRK